MVKELIIGGVLISFCLLLLIIILVNDPCHLGLSANTTLINNFSFNNESVSVTKYDCGNQTSYLVRGGW